MIHTIARNLRQASSISALEALVNASVGLVVSWLLTMWALPFWGYHPGPGAAAGITALYFVASFARAFAIREAFRRWAV